MFASPALPLLLVLPLYLLTVPPRMKISGEAGLDGFIDLGDLAIQHRRTCPPPTSKALVDPISEFFEEILDDRLPTLPSATVFTSPPPPLILNEHMDTFEVLKKKLEVSLQKATLAEAQLPFDITISNNDNDDGTIDKVLQAEFGEDAITLDDLEDDLPPPPTISTLQTQLQPPPTQPPTPPSFLKLEEQKLKALQNKSEKENNSMDWCGANGEDLVGSEIVLPEEYEKSVVSENSLQAFPYELSVLFKASLADLKRQYS